MPIIFILIQNSANLIVFSRTSNDFTSSGALKFERTYSYLRHAGKDTLLLHAGRGVPAPGRRFSRSMKDLLLSLEALSRLGIRFINAGRTETAWDHDLLIKEASKRGVRIISTCIESTNKKPVFAEYDIEKVGEVKFLIAGATDRISFHHPGLTLLSPLKCGEKIQKFIEEKAPDALILLADARGKWISRLVRQIKKTSVKVLIFNAGEKGFDYAPYAIRENIYLIRTPGAWRYPSRIQMSEDLTLRGEIPDVKEEEPAKGRGNFLKLTPPVPGVQANIPQNFTGWKKCAECHEKETESWKNTTHAKSWNAVKQMRRAEDPACGVCHLTGWLGGFKMPGEKFTSFFTGVECEACHGPGKLHVEGKFPYPQKFDRKICYTCHRDGYSRRLKEGHFKSVH